jgi:hypothetical protein
MLDMPRERSSGRYQQLASVTRIASRTLQEQNFEMKRGIGFEMKIASATTLLSRQ